MTIRHAFVLFAALFLVIVGAGMIVLGYDAITSSPILNEDTRLAGIMLEIFGVACIGAAAWRFKENFFEEDPAARPNPHAS